MTIDRYESATPIQSAERIALFIDGANLDAAAKALGLEIDFKLLLQEFQSRGRLVRASFYTVIAEDQEYSSVRPFTDWLAYNGYTVVTKAAKEFVDAAGHRKIKANIAIELAVDMLEMVRRVDHLVLFSGDGSYCRLVEAAQRGGSRVTVVSTVSTQPPIVADELRRRADVFIDLEELRHKIGRNRFAEVGEAGGPDGARRAVAVVTRRSRLAPRIK